MSSASRGYQELGDRPADDTLESGPTTNVFRLHSTQRRTPWSHVDNLDEFFTRIYEYHQRHGFLCMVVSEVLELFQFVFVVAFSVFLIDCVDYKVLFKDKLPHNATSHYQKVKLSDAVRPTCARNLSFPVVFCLIIAAAFWLHRLLRVLYHSCQYWEIRSFYISALKIDSTELENLTWHEVLQRLCQVQAEHQLCIHKRDLQELDIYQRILRYKNFFVAMVNKNLLPPRMEVPLLGECVFFSNGFKLNLELILFWGPWTPWKTYGQLKEEYKRRDKRAEVIVSLRRVALWFGVINLLLSPLVFIWQLLYSFFNYAELIKRDPGFLGARRWSLFGRYYFRHLNELDHEMNMRLSRAYRPASQYLDLFISSLMEVIAKNVAFFIGALLAVLLVLTAYDEDVIQVEHVITGMTLFSIVIIVCRTFMPDENLVWCPELLMNCILAQVHYMPDSWKGLAHTEVVRKQFSNLFQYKAVFLLEELLSPLITPLLLLFWFRPRCGEFADFFRNFTMEVEGLGDVCSFAQMDVKKHGSPKWQPGMEPEDNKLPRPPSTQQQDDADESDDLHQQLRLINMQTELGKTELSLIHFTVTNPNWNPPVPSVKFLSTLQNRVRKDASLLQQQQMALLDNPLGQSLRSLIVQPMGLPSMLPPQLTGFVGSQSQRASASQSVFGGGSETSTVLRGRGISRCEGPMAAAPSQLSSMIHSVSPSVFQPDPTRNQSPARQDLMPLTTATDMSLNVLYLHGLHTQQQLTQPQYGSTDFRTDVVFSRLQEENELQPLDAHVIWEVPEQPHPYQHQTAPDNPNLGNLVDIENDDDEEGPPQFFKSV